MKIGVSYWLSSAAIAAVLAAFISTSLAYVFSERAKRKKLISEALASVASSGRMYRNYYMRMVEYDIDFRDQQNSMAIALKQKNVKAFEVHKEAGKFAQQVASRHQDNILIVTTKLMQSAFLLAAYINKDVRKYKLQDEVNAVIEFNLCERSHFDKAMEEIDNGLLPHIGRMEQICNRLLWKQNQNLVVSTVRSIYGVFKKK
ncbi:MAG: hypothetical protein ACHQTE_00260 [Candidatus Saccharimonadales bacterium]